MGWKTIEKATTWDFGKNPVLTGVMVGKDTGIGKNNSNLYKFELQDGTIVSVWGSVVLDDRLGSIETGTEVRIEYKGMIKNEASGRSFKNFIVSVAE